MNEKLLLDAVRAARKKFWNRRGIVSHVGSQLIDYILVAGIDSIFTFEHTNLQDANPLVFQIKVTAYDPTIFEDTDQYEKVREVDEAVIREAQESMQDQHPLFQDQYEKVREVLDDLLI